MTMDKQFVATSASPHILLEVSGNLQLKGQDSSEVKVKSDNPEDITLEAHDEQVTIHSKGDCVVRVPRLATIQVQAVHGDATIKALEGELTIEKVDGNLAMRNLGETRINRINGDLSAKNVDGNLIIDSISGDVSARGVQGDFAITGRLNGNLNLSDVGGSAKASAEGNMMLNLDPAPAHQFEFTARGNLFCRLPEDAGGSTRYPRFCLRANPICPHPG
jgi:DUF4097 and DUF4098 domain-containing protein YvlB